MILHPALTRPLDPGASGGALDSWRNLPMRCWQILTRGAERRRATAQLKAMSDVVLKDLGLTRMEIGLAVRGLGRWRCG